MDSRFYLEVYVQMCPSRLVKTENDFFCFCVKDVTRGNSAFGPIIRDVYLMECCTYGAGSVSINGVRFPVKAGDCYVLLPGDKVTHTSSAGNPRAGYSCALRGKEIGRAFAAAGITSQKPFVPQKLFQKILTRMEKLEQLRYATDISAEYLRMAYTYEILSMLTRNTQEKEWDAWASRVLRLIEARYDQPITVQWLADQMGLERCYFSKLFKEKTGSTPAAYLAKVRIEKACALLRESGEPVAAVAAAVGQDSRNFARSFKKVTGKTPRQYLAEQ